MDEEKNSMLTLIKRSRLQKVIRNKERHYIIIKGSILHEDITIFLCVCTYQQSNKLSEVKTNKLKGELYEFYITIGVTSSIRNEQI